MAAKLMNHEGECRKLELENKKTHCTQTDLSHFRRDNFSQVGSSTYIKRVYKLEVNQKLA
jgi:hypothetical protein